MIFLHSLVHYDHETASVRHEPLKLSVTTKNFIFPTIKDLLMTEDETRQITWNDSVVVKRDVYTFAKANVILLSENDDGKKITLRLTKGTDDYTQKGSQEVIHASTDHFVFV